MSKTEFGASRTLLSFCKARGFHSSRPQGSFFCIHAGRRCQNRFLGSSPPCLASPWSAKARQSMRVNGGRYGMIAFTSTMSVSLFILMPAHKTSYALIYNRVGKWNSMVRAGQVFRYLAATPTAAFLTRLTKISTGHASPTAGAASAMLLILLIQVIGDGVTRSA